MWKVAFSAAVAAISVVAVAQVRAVWTGEAMQVWTVTSKLVWKCGYTTGAGPVIYKLFRDLPCPPSIEVE